MQSTAHSPATPPHGETLLERAVRRELDRLERMKFPTLGRPPRSDDERRLPAWDAQQRAIPSKA